jgi:hypothetical protein
VSDVTFRHPRPTGGRTPPAAIAAQTSDASAAASPVAAAQWRNQTATPSADPETYPANAF